MAHAQAPGKIPHVGAIYLSGHHRVIVDGLRQGLHDLGLDEGKVQDLASGGVQAYFHTPGGPATSQAPLIIDAARTKKLPTMFHDTGLVALGALAAYGHNGTSVVLDSLEWGPSATATSNSLGAY